MIALVLGLLLLLPSPQASGVVTGVVRSGNGSPAARVRVYAITYRDAVDAATTPPAMERLTETDIYGRYRLELPPGRYHIASGSVGAPTYYPGTTDIAQARVVSIAAGGLVEKMDFSSFVPASTTASTGVVSRITLSAPGFAVEILDAKARNDFRFGGGPGNFLNGNPNWGSTSWIVQGWDQPVAEPDPSFRRVKATFSLDRGRGAREYVVFYVYDPVAKQGFVYLPGRGEPFYTENTNFLYRGEEFEGHWFRARPEWTTEAQATIEKAGK
jgi:hypothetical protein